MSDELKEKTDAELWEMALGEEPVSPLDPETVDETVEAPEEPVPEAETTAEADEPVAGVEEPETTETEPAASEEPEAEQEASPNKGWVPPSRLREQTEKRKEAEAALEAERSQTQALLGRLEGIEKLLPQLIQRQQPQQQPEDEPDPYLEPEEAIRRTEERLEAKIQRAELNASLRVARRAYGDEFDAAYSSVLNSGDPLLARRMMADPDPGEAIWTHYQREQTLSKVGNDPDQWFQARLQEALSSDPALLQQALDTVRGTAKANSDTGAPNINLAPSVNAGTRDADAVPRAPGQKSEQELFDQYGR